MQLTVDTQSKVREKRCDVFTVCMWKWYQFSKNGIWKVYLFLLKMLFNNRVRVCWKHLPPPPGLNLCTEQPLVIQHGASWQSSIRGLVSPDPPILIYFDEAKINLLICFLIYFLKTICQCGEQSEPLPFFQLVHYVSASALWYVLWYFSVYPVLLIKHGTY